MKYSLPLRNYALALFTLASLVLSAFFVQKALAQQTGATYYVDCVNGLDTNDGLTESTAWKTLTNVNDNSNNDGDPAFVLQPGDSLLFKRDCAWNGPLNARWNGTAEQPITIGAYGSEFLPKPVIQNAGHNMHVTGSYQTIQHFKTHNDLSSYPAVALDCTPEGNDQGVGFMVGFYLEDGSHHNTLQNNETSQHAVGISLRRGSHHNTIRYNSLSNNNGIWDKGRFVFPDGHTGTADIGAMGMLLHGNDNDISYNTFDNDKASCPNAGADPNWWGIYESNAIEIYGSKRNNIHHNTSTQGVRVFSELGTNKDNPNTQQNEEYVSEDITFAYNRFTTDLVRGRFINTRGSGQNFGPVWRTKAYNNTVYFVGTEDEAIICTGCAGDILTLKNNIIWSDYKVAFFGNGLPDESNNTFWSTNGAPLLQCSGPCTTYNIHPTSRIANPEFVDVSVGDFHLLASSPAVNAGSNDSLIAGYTVDLDGVSIPQWSLVDNGVYENVSEPLPTAIPTATATPTTTPTPTPTPIPDVTNPTVAITFPVNGAVVTRSSTVTIAANAADNIGVTRVEFYVGTTLVCTDTSTAYTCNWSVPGAKNKIYTLQAKAYDAANNSAAHSITVTAK